MRGDSCLSEGVIVEARELLVRIDERTGKVQSDIKELKTKINNLECQKNSTRLEALEKVIWPSIVSGISGIIALFFFIVKGKGGV